MSQTEILETIAIYFPCVKWETETNALGYSAIAQHGCIKLSVAYRFGQFRGFVVVEDSTIFKTTISAESLAVVVREMKNYLNKIQSEINTVNAIFIL